MTRLGRALVHVHRRFFELIRVSPLYRWTALASVVLVVLMVALPLWKILPGVEGQAAIPLHYNIYFGVDRYGPWWQVFTLPAIGFTLLVVNTLFQAVYYHRERVLSYFFAVTSLLAEIALFTAVFFVVLLNL